MAEEGAVIASLEFFNLHGAGALQWLWALVLLAILFALDLRRRHRVLRLFVSQSLLDDVSPRRSVARPILNCGASSPPGLARCSASAVSAACLAVLPTNITSSPIVLSSRAPVEATASAALASKCCTSAANSRSGSCRDNRV